MNNTTKIKLINSLIDAVSHFYDLKQKGKGSNQKHLKGFCEGMAYTLVQIDAIDADEAKRILQGLGKHMEEIKDEKVEIKVKEIDPNDLEVPTIFRKNKNDGEII